MNDVDVSVVIPVKDGEKYLGSALKAVFSQQTSFKFEVIIIDSGSKDNILDIIKKYPIILYEIKKEDFNHGLTRNFGISKAFGRYVVLMTQDAVPCDKYWMERLVNNLEHDGRVAGVYSRQIPRKDMSDFYRIVTNRPFALEKEKRISQIDRIEDYNKLPPHEKYYFCNFDNVSSCVRKAVWENFKFSETQFGEDIEWAKNVLEAGYKIVYEPESMVYHSHDYSITEWYKRNKVNYNKLNALFGVNGVNNLFKAMIFSIIYSTSDFYNFIRFCVNRKDIKAFVSGAFLIPIYSLARALGQYRGIK